MDLSFLFIALPIFFLVYQGMGLLLTARQNTPAGLPRSGSHSLQKTLRDTMKLGAKLGINKALLANKSFRDRLEILLIRSGNQFRWRAEEVLFSKELVALFLAGLLWFGSPIRLLSLVGIALGWILPDLFLKAKGGARKALIQRALPGFVDLLALALESGLDLLAGTERILGKMRPNPLREELEMLIQENRLGTPRKEALQHWAFRTDLPDIYSLTSMIIQSEELGTSLAGVLRNYAEDMRNKRILRAEEIGGKAPVKLLFPMMVFFFPIVFVVIFGPLALSLMSSYK